MSNCPHCGEATWTEGKGCEFGCHERAELQAELRRATSEADALRAEVARLREALDAMNGTVQIAHALEDGAISDQWSHVFEDLLSDQCKVLKSFSGPKP